MHDQENPEALDLYSYLRPIWRRKWIVLAIVVVAAVATYVISSRQATEYTASTQVYVQVADPTTNVGNPTGAPSAPVSIQQLADVSQLLTAQSVATRVSRLLGIPIAAARAVTATPSTNSDFITITATSRSPMLAARLANAYVNVFLSARRRSVASEAFRALQAARASLSSLPSSATGSVQRQTLLDQIAGYEQIASNPTTGIQQVNSAAVPRFPSSPTPKRDAIFGAVVGLVLAIIVAFVLELLDRRLTRVGTVESILGRPVLAVLPHVDDPVPQFGESGPVVPPPFLEELRSVRVMLRLSDGHRDQPVIMITSALPREGKSTVTRDLALIYAESGDRVLVIDSDLRRPSVHRLFGLELGRGLVHVLRGEATLAEATQSDVTARSVSMPAANGNGSAHRPPNSRTVGAIDILACGERLDNPIALLASDQMWALLEEARESYDVVLLDTAPVLTVVDNLSQMERVDAVLLVTRLGQLTRDSARRFNDVVARLSNVHIAGVIVNDQRYKTEDGGYGSYGRYGYGYYSDARRTGETASMMTMS